jgi:hypothetical protein
MAQPKGQSAKKRTADRQSPGGHPLAGSERPPGPKTMRLEAADADEMVKITLIVRRRLDAPPAPIAAGAKLSRQEFEEAQGSTQADLDEVGEMERPIEIILHGAPPPFED